MTSRAVAFLLVAMLLCGCGGGGGASNSTPASGGHGGALFSIAIPAPSAQARRGAYVSSNAATLDLSIAFAGGANVLSESVALSGAGCTASAGARTCTVSVSLDDGSYVADVSTLSSTGAVLSQGQNLAFTVSGASATPVALTLDGVPASLQITLPPSGVAGSVAQGLIVNAPFSLNVVAQDASGAAIVGAGSPAIIVTSANGAFTVTSSPTGAYAITPPTGFSASTTQLTLTATGGGASVSQTLAVTTQPQALYVSNIANNSISVYTPPYAGASPVATISTGIAYPSGLALDGKGDLFAAQFNTGSVNVYTPPYTGAPTVIPIGPVDAPAGIAVDGSGDLYVSNLYGSDVEYFAPPLSASSTPAALLGTGYGPEDIAIAQNGSVFVATYGNDTIDVFSPPFSGTVTPSAVLGNPQSVDGGLVPFSLTTDAAGNLWVAWVPFTVFSEVPQPTHPSIAGFRGRYAGPAPSPSASSSPSPTPTSTPTPPSNGMITMYAPPFTGTMLPTTVIAGSPFEPIGIAIPKVPGATTTTLFVPDAASGKVLMFTPPFNSQSTGTPLAGSVELPFSSFAGSDGTLYVADIKASSVLIYTPPYTGNPQTIQIGIAVPIWLTAMP